MKTTVAEETLLRTRPHNTKLYLSIYKPNTVLACQVNDVSISKGARTINYDNVTSGSYQLIQSGMTMYVGSYPGWSDRGRIRVRFADASKITVVENSHIDWEDDLYLTVVSFFEISARYPRIVASGTSTYWYKEYDIPYTNQNSVLGSFVCMGSHFAGFLEGYPDDPGGQHCEVYYSASGTSNLKGEPLSYFWFFEGATVTGSNQHTPGYITYNAPGFYTTRLIVSGTASADISYRHVSIHDRPDINVTSAWNLPVIKWSLTDLSGSRDQGGYMARIRIDENVPDTVLRDGSLIVIFADDWYGNTKQSIGGNSLGRQHIVFTGYVMDGTIQYNYQSSFVEFEVGSPTEIMKISEGFSVSIQDSRDPSNDAATNPDIPSGWVVLLDMDIKRAIYHYLKWHSTVLLCCDFQYKGYDYPIQYFDSDRTSLYDAVNSLLEGAVPGKLVSDRQGKLWAESDIFIDWSYYDEVMQITKQDWMGDPVIDQSMVDTVSSIEVGGIAYKPLDNPPTSTAYLSAAPGTTPNYKGKVMQRQGLALDSQAQLNSLAGNLLAQLNNQFPAIDLTLAGNYRNYDIAPQERIFFNIDDSDTVRGFHFTSKRFYITDMRWSYDPKNETFIPNVTLCAIQSGMPGETIPIPAVAPVEGDDGGGWEVPPIVIPPIVIPPISIPSFILTGFPIYDDGIFIVTGTAMDFAEGLSVTHSGSLATIHATSTTGSAISIYDDGTLKGSVTAISFGKYLDAGVTGSFGYVKVNLSGATGTFSGFGSFYQAAEHGYNVTDNLQLNASVSGNGSAGISCIAGKRSVAAANIVTPVDATSVTITPLVLIPNGAGNVVLKTVVNSVQYFNPTSNGSGANSGNVTYAASYGGVTLGPPVTITITNQAMIMFYTSREGTDANDTYTGAIQVKGWLFQYE